MNFNWLITAKIKNTLEQQGRKYLKSKEPQTISRLNKAKRGAEERGIFCFVKVELYYESNIIIASVVIIYTKCEDIITIIRQALFPVL